MRRDAVVLAYHRVLPPASDSYSHAGISVLPDTFDRQMAFLAQHFRPLTQTQFESRLSESCFDKRSCLVTFDDGWQDNVAHALPVLQRHQVPAIVFVATGLIGTSETFWQERLTRLLCAAALAGSNCAALLSEFGFHPDQSMDRMRLRAAAREFVTALKTQDPAVPKQMIERIRAALAGAPAVDDLGADRFMSWDDLRTLQDSGLVSIGSHSHSHTRLTTLGYEGARAELERSRQMLAQHGFTEVAACAYPNGDVTDPVEAAATDAGFVLGFGTRTGLVRHRTEAMHLKRVNIHEADSSSNPEFLYRLLGLP
jgi:peptidoglycan/xylan/chitin deacetylase (PgdA/CDA1 family)